MDDCPTTLEGSVLLPVKYRKYQDVFEESAADQLPEHRPGVDLEINLLDDEKSYPYKQCYALSVTEDKVLREYIDENLKRGFIAESRSPMGAPVLFVKKKDGNLRLCVDYRGPE